MAAARARTDDPSKPPHLSFFRVAPAGVTIVPPERRLGILSAAFNPITRAHLALAHSAYDHYQLHEVLFVLPITQPHKRIYDAPIEARLQMMNLAVQGNPAFSIGACTHGLFIDICRATTVAYPPQTRLWFITGRDATEEAPSRCRINRLSVSMRLTYIIYPLPANTAISPQPRSVPAWPRERRSASGCRHRYCATFRNITCIRGVRSHPRHSMESILCLRQASLSSPPRLRRRRCVPSEVGFLARQDRNYRPSLPRPRWARGSGAGGKRRAWLDGKAVVRQPPTRSPTPPTGS
jgi:nicotinic acid mononucleotide adenylyltransferase